MWSWLIKLGVLALLLTPSVSNAEWTKTDTLFQITQTSLNVVDWAQTRYISRNPDRYWEETNPILRGNPSTSSVDTYFLIAIPLKFAISYILPQPYRRIWQTTNIGINGRNIIHNNSIGIRIRF
jgi:hypothetical protein